MGAAVTVSNAETSRAVRAELRLFPASVFFLLDLEDSVGKDFPLGLESSSGLVHWSVVQGLVTELRTEV